MTSTEGRVTQRDIIDAVNRLEDKVDAVLKDHEQRIRANENFKNRSIGIMGVFSLFFSAIATYLWERVVR